MPASKPLLLLLFLGMAGLAACDDPSPRQERKLPIPKGENTLDDVLRKSAANPPVAPRPGRLLFDADSLVFGSVAVGETRNRQIVLRNDGDETLVLDRMRLAGQAASYRLGGQCQAGVSLAPHAGCILEIAFHPSAEGGAEAEATAMAGGVAAFLALYGTAVGAPAHLQAGIAPSRNVEASLDFARLRQDSGLVVESNGGGASSPPDARQADYTEAGLPGIVSSFPVDRTRVITADRYIPAVLENTLNSQLPGRAIAVVERNVYGAEGRSVLIPAGARAIGSYRSLARYGEARIDITWSRIILPNGVNINIDNQSADVMGRTGLPGDLDTRFFEKYGSSLLTSAIAAAGDWLLDGSSTTVASQFGGTTQTMSGRARAATRLGNDIDSLGQRMVQENVDIRPVLTVPQGTRLDIIPSEDIWLRDPGHLRAVTPPKEHGGRTGIAQADAAMQMIPGVVDLIAQNPALQRLAPQTSQQLQQAAVLQQLRDYGAGQGYTAPAAASQLSGAAALSPAGGTGGRP